MKFAGKTRQKKLLNWFKENKRDLPWRETKDPYRIWISEVMLQQTAVRAVIPYYKKFLSVFPDIKSLAGAQEEKVYILWAGLGYYSRARNLVKAARIINKKGKFPETFRELLKLPGFGPYTARAVSGLAFEERAGVLDGNVIRFLSRFHGLPLKWWLTEGRNRLQELADLWVKGEKPSLINQALMEQGALVCAKKPLCFLCAVREDCTAFRKGATDLLPLKREKPSAELLHWKPLIIRKSGRLAFVRNTKLPFLKNYPVFPGALYKTPFPPKNSDFCHSITRYKIYVSVKPSVKMKSAPPASRLIWIPEPEIPRQNPSSLIRKILKRRPPLSE